MNTQVCGEEQLRDCKCLLLTTLRSNHPLGHGLFSSSLLWLFCLEGEGRKELEIKKIMASEPKENLTAKITIKNLDVGTTMV